MSRFKPIGEYGLIGDMHTAALVGRDGSIDWMCLPDFDSPSLFAAILDPDKGGYFKIAPVAPTHVPRQFYFPETNVLITRYSDADSVAQVADFMLVHDEPSNGAGNGETHHASTLVRHVTGVQGTTHLLDGVLPALRLRAR